MQTFLPFDDFVTSLKSLDYRRLGKQRVEAMQILNALTGESKGWVNHPATKMWRGYENALRLYMNLCIDEWIARGYNNNMLKAEIVGDIIYPPWFGSVAFHRSHQSNLKRKDPVHYSQFDVPTNLEYVWP